MTGGRNSARSVGAHQAARNGTWQLSAL